MTHATAAKESPSGCNEFARKLLPGRCARFLSDRSLAKDSAGLAGAHHRPPDGKIKGREVRRGRAAEERRRIKHFTRGAK
jgi:hypothetical protein